MKRKACSIIGLRPQALPFREGDAQYLQMMEKMGAAIQNAIKNDFTTFLSGGSMGPDVWFAETVYMLKGIYPQIWLQFILPYEAQANRWPEHWRERYLDILEKADDVVYLSQQYTPTCVYERNKALIDRSALLLAVYDGISAGRTKHTINYAEKHNVEVVQLLDF